MLFLDSKEIPHAAPEDLEETGQEGQEGALRDEDHDVGRNRQGPGVPKEQVHHDGRVIDRRILVAEVVPQEPVLGIFF